MVTVSLEEIGQNLSGYLSRVEAGETVLVLREGRVVAEIKPAAGGARAARRPRPYGLCAGEFAVPENFDEPLPEKVLRGYEGL